jgi:hypothetical protein
MKIVNEIFLLKSGDFAESLELNKILEDIREAIKEVTWFSESEFIINPVRKGNGVVPIKGNFIKKLVSAGWRDEIRMSLVKGINPGPIDVIIETSFGKFAVEWETGNISSSHRAMNKIAVGIIQKEVIGGILILPARSLAQYLTDRIGNIEEILPYFCLYQNLNISSGVLGVISVEHDGISKDAPLIGKGQDGNAIKRNLF